MFRLIWKKSTSLPSFLSCASVVSVVNFCDVDNLDHNILSTERNKTVADKSKTFLGTS